MTHSKDTSRKIRAVFKAKGQAGKPLCTNPPYGYVKDPEDKLHWIVDEDAAKVVRDIFRLCIQGYGVSQIAKEITKRHIMNPTAHAKANGINIPDERFVKMSENYEAEQKTLECRVVELRSMISTQQESSVNVDLFLAKVRKYTDVRELTPEIIREFVARIEVFKPERINGHKVQRMRIVWNCIGEFIPPQPKKDEKTAYFTAMPIFSGITKSLNCTAF